MATATPDDVERALAACERELAGGGTPDLRALGFWRAVNALKRRPEWVERYAERTAAIDREAFRRAVRPVFPVALGVAALVLGVIVGVGFFALASTLEPTLAGVAVLLGTGALLGATHGLAHLIVGSAAGIHFTDWFMDIPRRPQPGFKIDYASYLRASPSARAWMHASGPIVTKIVPFAAVPLALAFGTPWWTTAILLAVGVVQLVTDALWSVRSSDWKRFRREMRIARAISGSAARGEGS
jgi:hypothetical protein